MIKLIEYYDYKYDLTEGACNVELWEAQNVFIFVKIPQNQTQNTEFNSSCFFRHAPELEWSYTLPREDPGHSITKTLHPLHHPAPNVLDEPLGFPDDAACMGHDFLQGRFFLPWFWWREVLLDPVSRPVGVLVACLSWVAVLELSRQGAALASAGRWPPSPLCPPTAVWSILASALSLRTDHRIEEWVGHGVRPSWRKPLDNAERSSGIKEVWGELGWWWAGGGLLVGGRSSAIAFLRSTWGKVRRLPVPALGAGVGLGG